MEKAKSLHALRLPLNGKSLVVPHSAIVEIVKYQKVEPLLGSKPYVIGSFTWRNIKLPLFSFEILIGSHSKISKDVHVAVFNRLHHDKNTASTTNENFFAILLQNLPHPVVLTPDLERVNHFLGDYELDYVLIEGQEAIIPNIQAISELAEEVHLH
jgi:chemosensory pili system protein ChpC